MPKDTKLKALIYKNPRLICGKPLQGAAIKKGDTIFWNHLDQICFEGLATFKACLHLERF